MDLKIQFGEILYLIRPLIHCTLLYIYGSDSYKPYLISLIIDIFRYYNDLCMNKTSSVEEYVVLQEMWEVGDER